MSQIYEPIVLTSALSVCLWAVALKECSLTGGNFSASDRVCLPISGLTDVVDSLSRIHLVTP